VEKFDRKIIAGLKISKDPKRAYKILGARGIIPIANRVFGRYVFHFKATIFLPCLIPFELHPSIFRASYNVEHHVDRQAHAAMLRT
jgi:hypothetical protein